MISATCPFTCVPLDYARKLVESEEVRYVEPVPSSLKISPGAISYSSQQVDGGLGGSASTVLKFAQLGQHDMAVSPHPPGSTTFIFDASLCRFFRNECFQLILDPDSYPL